MFSHAFIEDQKAVHVMVIGRVQAEKQVQRRRDVSRLPLDYQNVFY